MACQSLQAAEFCALTVHVEGSSGPITSTWADLTDPSGKVVLRRMVKADFQICDFGFGSHTLRVGLNECLPVSISNLQVRLGHPLVLRVVLNDCGYRYGGSNGCEVYLRATDAQGQPLAGVVVTGHHTGGFQRTDDFGRASGSLLNGSADDLEVSLTGYATAVEHVECKDSAGIDKAVVLNRR